MNMNCQSNEPHTYRFEVNGVMFEFVLSTKHEPDCQCSARMILMDELQAILITLSKTPDDVPLEAPKVTLEQFLAT